jgi:LysR family transcriptional regulator (chromosome initiation inhibitor)
MASRAYVERYLANGVTPASVAGAPALTFNQKDTVQHAWLR